MPSTILQNQYTVQKTISFDLKAKSTTDNFEFINSQKWLEEQFTNEQTKEPLEIGKYLEFSKELRLKYQELINVWSIEEIIKCFKIHKYLIEFADRNKYHNIKSKTIKIQEINPINGNKYLVDYRIKDVTNLFVVNKAMQGGATEISIKITELLDKLGKFENRVRKDFILKNDQINKHLFSGKVTYYSNIRAWIDTLESILKTISWIEIDEISQLPVDQELKQLFDSIITKKNTFTNLGLDSLKEVANDNTKQEFELTTLNFRSVNKDPSKIQEEESEVEKLRKQMINLESELAVTNTQKLEYAQKLDYALTHNLPELDLLNTKNEAGENCNKLFIAKSKGQTLNDDEEKLVKQMKFQKTVLKHLKLNGILVTDKSDLDNYRQSGEKLNWRNINKYWESENRKKPTIFADGYKIEKLVEYPKFAIEYNNYKQLLEKKFDKARELGDAKSLYYALFREVGRQKQCNHFSTICRDTDTENPFYYLVLIPNTDKNSMNQTYQNLQTKGEGLQLLKMERLTFKALEKLALLESSSFNQDFEGLGNIKQLQDDFKKKSHKQYKLSKGEKQNIPWKDVASYTIKMETEHLQKLIKYCNNCIQKLIAKENYNFEFDFDKKFDDFDDYKNYIDQQCYSKKWLNISLDKAKELEKNGEVRIFKIHNKDFRKTKKSEQKDNLFTKYWLDAMIESNSIVRILPEIDIFKRPKEEQKEQKTKVLKTSNKEVVKKARIYQDKLQAAFRLEFYPANKTETLENINKNIKDGFGDKVYYLGIDRGENELASFCLIDSTGQLIKNGCWNVQTNNNLGEKGINFADKIKAFYNTNEKQGLISLFDKKRAAQMAISEENNPEQKKIRQEEFNLLEEKLKEANQLATDFVKNAYCAYMIGEINKILVEYPNTYIVLEDLDIVGKVKETDESNKEQNLQKTLGASVYQVIENAIVNKFKYYTVKTGQFTGQQLVPNITKVEDLRVKEIIKVEDNSFGKIKITKSKNQIGNILFVDEKETSITCPNCLYCANKAFRQKIETNKVLLENSPIGVYAQINNKNFYLPDQQYLENDYVQWVKQNLGSEIQSNTQKNKLIDLLQFRSKSAKSAFSYGFAIKLDVVNCPDCLFSSINYNTNTKLINDIYSLKTGDEVASYNIAKRGLEQNN